MKHIGLSRTCPLGSIAVHLSWLILAALPLACSGGGGSGGGVAATPGAAIDDSSSTVRSSARVVDVLANDPPGSTLLETTPPANGSARVVGSEVLYTPNSGFLGDDEFTYTARDTDGTLSTATVRMTVINILTTIESEPNSTLATADVTSLGLAATGDIDDVDVDFWSFPATAGETIQIELFATRLVQQFWDEDCLMPYLTLLDPSGNAVLEHLETWSWGAHDLDVPAYLVRETGTHTVRLQARDAIGSVGASLGPAPYTLLVKRAPFGVAQEEAEPRGVTGLNEMFLEDAEPIEPGTIHGYHAIGDVDLYSFTITEPTLIYLEVTSYRNGAVDGANDYFNPALQLYDTDGSFLFYSEDAFFWDPAISFLLDLPGTYTFEVSGFFVDRGADYLVTFETTPLGEDLETEPNDSSVSANLMGYGEVVSGVFDGDPDIFAFAGDAGDMVRVWFFNEENHLLLDPALDLRLLDSDGVSILPADGPGTELGRLNVARTILTESSTFFIEISGPAEAAPSIYSIRLERFAAADVEVEPNEVLLDANRFGGLGRVHGVIEGTLDEDTYSFEAEAGEFVSIAIYADLYPGLLPYSNGFFELSGHGSTLAPGLEIRDAAGTLALTVYETDGLCVSGESITNGLATLEAAIIAPTTGTYFVTVFSQFELTVDDRPYYVLERR